MLEDLSDEQLEQRLLELAYADGIPGRVLESQKSAIRTVLNQRRGRRAATGVDETIARAVVLVNEHRSARHRVTVQGMDEFSAASIVEVPAWAPLFATRRECEAARQAMSQRSSRRGRSKR